MSSVSGSQAPALEEKEAEPDSETGAPQGVGADNEMPPVSDYIREAARQAPDHWFWMIDPTWSGDGVPPEWAMVGKWRSGLDGEIVEWQHNEDYRPSPRALGWAEPTDPVDAAVQLAVTGYGPAEDVTRALVTADVAAFVTPGGGLLTAVAPDDEMPVVPVFTSPDHLRAAGHLSFRTLRVPELLEQVPVDHLIYLNASGPVSMTLEPDVLREAVEAAEDEDEENSRPGDLDDVLPAKEEKSGSVGITDLPTGDMF
ncbi:type VII secretion system-associated protein [Streptomyces sp. NPDC051172]|uniref:type VII secretion system-associated protein n=1 Tax=Streptomyces sp. NPDC051172 TaxID=3155796 RepID=UPI0034429C5B